jgi:hypothetical protein
VAAPSVHVVPHGNEWVVEQNGRQLSKHSTQAEAEKHGREEAMRAKAELVMQGRDGRIGDEDSHGHDPRSIKG